MLNDNIAKKPSDRKISQIVKSAAKRLENMQDAWLTIRYNPFKGTLSVQVFSELPFSRCGTTTLKTQLLDNISYLTGNNFNIKGSVESIDLLNESKIPVTNAGDIYLRVIRYIHDVSVEFKQIRPYDIIDKMRKLYDIRLFLNRHVSEIGAESDLGENCANKMIATYDEYIKQLKKHDD